MEEALLLEAETCSMYLRATEEQRRIQEGPTWRVIALQRARCSIKQNSVYTVESRVNTQKATCLHFTEGLLHCVETSLHTCTCVAHT